jgi:hypothetical protein
MKNSLIEAAMAFINQKYGYPIANNTEYDYIQSENSNISRIIDENGKIIGFLTSWIENNEIKHHIG